MIMKALKRETLGAELAHAEYISILTYDSLSWPMHSKIYAPFMHDDHLPTCHVRNFND